MEKTLMHTCCAPCSVACIHQLRSEGIEPVSYWFNPNIHPYQEYKARRDTLMAYAPTIGMELIVQEDYGLRDFCSAVAGDIDHRLRPLLYGAAGADGPLCRREQLFQLHLHPVRQSLPAARADGGDRRGDGPPLRREVPVPGFPPRLPRRTAGGP